MTFKVHLITALLLLFTALCVVSCGNDEEAETATDDVQYELPNPKGGNCIIITHSTAEGVNYTLEWDCEKKAQRWSAYQLNSQKLTKKTSRYTSTDNQYPFDPQLSRINKDFYPSRDYYWDSGYEHGHICPSADRLYSQEANKQTFYLTNMQPQDHMMNSGSNSNSPWFRLEGQIRLWADATTTEMLYVVKGGTIDDDKIIKRIKGELRVPKYFFVALLLKNAQGFKAVGFWIEHDGKDHGNEPLSSYAMNIRQLERLTGIDFFYQLPDDTEEHVETLSAENIKRAWGIK